MKFPLQSLEAAFSGLRLSPFRSFSNIARSGIATSHLATHGRQFSSLPFKPSTSILSRIAEHRRFFSTKTDEPEFTITLYSINSKASYNGLPEQVTVPFSKHSAKKVCDIVAGFLNVNSEWDKKLLESVIFSKQGSDWFEFVKTENPDVSFRVKLEKNDKDAVLGEISEEVYAPTEKPGKISVAVREHSIDENYEVDLTAIKEKFSQDKPMVALLNSESFKRVVQSNTAGMSRTLEKQEVVVPCKHCYESLAEDFSNLFCGC